MELLNVSSPEFRPYGRVISGYDVSGLMKAMESTPLPEGVVYVASVPGLDTFNNSISFPPHHGHR